jgi:hypothetical protein
MEELTVGLYEIGMVLGIRGTIHLVDQGIIAGFKAVILLNAPSVHSGPRQCVNHSAAYWKCTNDPIAQSLTSALWPTNFGGDSDGIVPVTSQSGNGLLSNIATNTIHTSNLEFLGFTGLGETDSFVVANYVIQLLNSSVQPMSMGARAEGHMSKQMNPASNSIGGSGGL